jgi:ATP-dependent DNA helicase DinG
LWPRLDARAENCIGAKCPQWERCFITEMRRRGAESDVVIVNHHLFFADLALKQAAEGAHDAGVLPEAGVVIFDEAHELEDVASSYFGISVSDLRVQDLLRDTERTVQQHKLGIAGAAGSGDPRLRALAIVFFRAAAGRRPLRVSKPR